VLLPLGCLPCLFEFGSPLALGDSLAVLVVSFALMVFLLAEAPFGLFVWTERTIKHYYNQEIMIINPPG
jgi:uncharacterized RDD family membrane protein YckC